MKDPKLPKDEEVKMHMKYDVGKGGFEGMIIVLALVAVIVLILGLYFIFQVLLPSFSSPA